MTIDLKKRITHNNSPISGSLIEKMNISIFMVQF